MTDRIVRLGSLSLLPFREVRLGDVPTPISGKALKLLSVLAAANGALVTKDELMEAVWPGVIVEENAIQVHIAALRKTLGDEAHRLTTARGLGYRLAVDGEKLDVGQTPPFSSVEPVLAVLPFEIETGDESMRLFADGLSEDVIHAACRIAQIRVIARSSSFQLRGPDRSPQRAVSELGATHVLDGIVRRQGDSVRVQIELVDALSRIVLWSNRFDCNIGAIAGLCEDITEAIATSLHVGFQRRESRPVSAQAMDMYLKARALIGPKETNGTAVALLEASVACDPEMAQAWSALAYAEAVALRWHERRAQAEVLAGKIRNAATTALSLDPTSGTAHLALGLLNPLGNYRDDESQLTKAFELAPNDAAVLNRLAIFEFSVGRVRKAFSFAAKAFQSDPLSINVCANYSTMLAEIGLPKESDDVALAGNRRWPGNWWMIGVSMIRAASCGDWKAVDELSAVADADPTEGFEFVRFTVAALRNPDSANRAKVLDLCERQLRKHNRIQPSTLIFACNMGLVDEAFDWVDRSDYGHLFRVDGEPPETRGFAQGALFSVANARMRKEPRFATLCAKLGLCAYWLETANWPDCAADRLGYDFQSQCRNALI